MSKRREYRNLEATDAPQQKPGTAKQAHAEASHLQEKLRTGKRKDPTGENGPQRIGDLEVP